MRNYAIGLTELGLDSAEMEAHLTELLGAETSARIFTNLVRRRMGTRQCCRWPACIVALDHPL
jgi:hypothetical protein